MPTQVPRGLAWLLSVYDNCLGNLAYMDSFYISALSLKLDKNWRICSNFRHVSVTTAKVGLVIKESAQEVVENNCVSQLKLCDVQILSLQLSLLEPKVNLIKLYFGVSLLLSRFILYIYFEIFAVMSGSNHLFSICIFI